MRTMFGKTVTEVSEPEKQANNPYWREVFGKKLEYTPTPWQFGAEHEGMKEITDAKGHVIAQVKKCWIVDFPGCSGNARRIMACVNACEGISTRELEGRTVLGILEDGHDHA